MNRKIITRCKVCKQTLEDETECYQCGISYEVDNK